MFFQCVLPARVLLLGWLEGATVLDPAINESHLRQERECILLRSETLPDQGGNTYEYVILQTF